MSHFNKNAGCLGVFRIVFQNDKSLGGAACCYHDSHSATSDPANFLSCRNTFCMGTGSDSQHHAAAFMCHQTGCRSLVCLSCAMFSSRVNLFKTLRCNECTDKLVAMGALAAPKKPSDDVVQAFGGFVRRVVSDSECVAQIMHRSHVCNFMFYMTKMDPKFPSTARQSKLGFVVDAIGFAVEHRNKNSAKKLPTPRDLPEDQLRELLLPLFSQYFGDCPHFCQRKFFFPEEAGTITIQETGVPYYCEDAINIQYVVLGHASGEARPAPEEHALVQYNSELVNSNGMDCRSEPEKAKDCVDNSELGKRAMDDGGGTSSKKAKCDDDHGSEKPAFGDSLYPDGNGMWIDGCGNGISDATHEILFGNGSETPLPDLAWPVSPYGNWDEAHAYSDF